MHDNYSSLGFDLLNTPSSAWVKKLTVHEIQPNSRPRF